MDKPIIIVDFDGVLHSYTSGWQGTDQIPDDPVPGAIEWLERAVEYFVVAIFSSRSRDFGGIAAMQRWLGVHGLSSAAKAQLVFPMEKPPALVSIDDRAIQFRGVFPSMEEIRNFKPWNHQEV